MHPTVFRAPGLIAATLSLAFLAACSGGGNSAAPGAGAGGSRSGSLQFVVPPRSVASADGRKPAFISPSVESVAIAVTGVAGRDVVNLGAASPDCTTSAGGLTCDVPVTAEVGLDTISATLYSGPNATGNVLGGGSTTTNVSGNGFSVGVTVNGTPATLQLGSGSAAFLSGTTSSTTISVTVLDAGGNTITGTYANAVSLSVSNPAAFSIAPATVTGSGQTAKLTYNGAPGVTTVTISAAAANVTSGNVVPVVIPVAPSIPVPQALTLSNTFYQFNGTGFTTTFGIDGAAGTNFAAMTATSSDPSVASVAVDEGGREITVNAIGVGSATITVVPSDGSALAATLAVQVQTTTVEPAIAKLP